MRLHNYTVAGVNSVGPTAIHHSRNLVYSLQIRNRAALMNRPTLTMLISLDRAGSRVPITTITTPTH